MIYLLDTHVLLWADVQPERFRERVRHLLAEPKNELVLSVASLWEIAIKAGYRGVRLSEPLQQWVTGVLRDLRLSLLPIQPGHALAVADLPTHHRDPFDRLIIAQAICEKLPVITADPIFRKYPVEIVPA